MSDALKPTPGRNARLIVPPLVPALIAFGTAELTARVGEGWVSQCYGSRERAAAGVFEAAGKGHQVFVTLLIPGAANLPEEAAAIERRIVAEWRTAGFQNYSQTILFER